MKKILFGVGLAAIALSACSTDKHKRKSYRTGPQEVFEVQASMTQKGFNLAALSGTITEMDVTCDGWVTPKTFINDGTQTQNVYVSKNDTLCAADLKAFKVSVDGSDIVFTKDVADGTYKNIIDRPGLQFYVELVDDFTSPIANNAGATIAYAFQSVREKEGVTGSKKVVGDIDGTSVLNYNLDPLSETWYDETNHTYTVSLRCNAMEGMSGSQSTCYDVVSFDTADNSSDITAFIVAADQGETAATDLTLAQIEGKTQTVYPNTYAALGEDLMNNTFSGVTITMDLTGALTEGGAWLILRSGSSGEYSYAYYFIDN